MAVTPGSKSKLNTVKGVSAILSITNAEKTALSTKVLPANILTGWQSLNGPCTC